MNWKVWLHSIVAAAIGGASNAALGVVAMPDTFNFSHDGWINIAKITFIGALVPVLTLLKQSPLPDVSTTSTVTQKTTVDITKNVVILLALFLLGAMASAQTVTPVDPDNMYFAGVSYSQGATPSTAGTALYARKVADNSGFSTYAFTMVDAIPASVKPFTVSTNIGAGIAQKVATVAGIPIYVPTAAGISFNGNNTGWVWSTGAGAPFEIKKKGVDTHFYVMPTVRINKASIGNSGYQPIVGVLFGWGQ